MPRLVAILEHRYGGKLQKPGDQYDATERHALVLKAVKKAADAPTEAAPAPAPLRTRAMAPDPVPAMSMPEEPEAPAVPRRRYVRRDMRASEE